MCLAVPGKIVNKNGNKGTVEIGNMRREVFMLLVPEASVGEYVLVHAGCAIQTIDKQEAFKTLEVLKELAGNEIC